MFDSSPALPALRDASGRAVTYLRVSVTDRCNLHCAYCRPAGEPGEACRPPAARDALLTHGEVERVAGLLVRRGVTKIRLTGGEPLLRRGLARLCARLAALPGVRTLALTTNGTLLPPHLASLRAAGVTRLNISLDTLDRATFARLTGADRLPAVLAAVAGAAAAAFPEVRLNCVLQRSVNGDGLETLVDFALARGLQLRFIEAMPLGAGPFAPGEFVSVAEALARLRRRYPLVARLGEPDGEAGARGPALDYEIAGAGATVGFIPAHAGGFCPRCNRVRLLADGRLKPCLYAAPVVPLRGLLRAGAPEAALLAAVGDALARKRGDGRPRVPRATACWRAGDLVRPADPIAAVGG